MSDHLKILADLRLVPEGAAFAMLIRHAERESLEDGEVGEDCPLTAKGLNDARELGTRLCQRGVDHAYSSFVPRCVDTAKEILKGMDAGGAAVEIRKKLGDPGFYVSNPIAAALSFHKYGNAGVIEKFVADGGVSGFKPLDWGCRTFMQDIITDLSTPGTRNLYVSHDMIIIPLIFNFTGEQFGRQRWLDCLDGIIFFRDSDGLHAARGGKIYPVDLP